MLCLPLPTDTVPSANRWTRRDSNPHLNFDRAACYQLHHGPPTILLASNSQASREYKYAIRSCILRRETRGLREGLPPSVLVEEL
jgi:hypothetical protein